MFVVSLIVMKYKLLQHQAEHLACWQKRQVPSVFME